MPAFEALLDGQQDISELPQTAVSKWGQDCAKSL